MKLVKILFFFLAISLCGTAYSQNDCSYKQVIAKIDSISRARHTITGHVKILFVSNSFDKTDTEVHKLTKVSTFYFDDRFLVIEDKYFNLDKLLYFYIEEGAFEFFFQGY